jgi:hypothetical protein
MANQLASLTASYGKPQTVDNVVQTPLELLQQHLARHALGANRLLEIISELAFLGEIDTLCFLLFAKLQTIPDNLRLTIFAVLAGGEVALLDGTLIGKTLSALQKQLDALAAAKTAYCILVTCQCSSPVESIGLRGWRSCRPDQ